MRIFTQPMRVAIYTRVSTGSQTTENQLRELQAFAERNGWQVVATFTDEGIPGAKDRDQRPGLNSLLEGVTRRDFDRVMAWSVDRLGRSLPDLLVVTGELKAKGVDLYLHQQLIDTSTPAGKAMFQMLGVFSEFEREIIRERVNSGLARAKAQGKKLGRPRRDTELQSASCGSKVLASTRSPANFVLASALFSGSYNRCEQDQQCQDQQCLTKCTTSFERTVYRALPAGASRM